MAVFIHCALSHITFSLEMVTKIVLEKELILLFFLSLLLCIITLFILFSLGSQNYMKSDVNKITNNIVTPKAVGQGQHGTSRWLTDKEFKKFFKFNTIKNKKVKSNFKLLNKIKSRLYIAKIRFFKSKKKKEKIQSGGLVVGYEKNKSKEKIYYIDDNIHSLIVGATRSGKSRCVVLQTIGNLALAGESMIISDPKSELYHYTSKYLEEMGYKIITIDFRNPLKSSRYNFLQPVIDAVNNNDYRKIEEKTILLLEYQGKYAIQKRREKGLLAGLWELPNLEGKYSKQEMLSILKEENKRADVYELGPGKHIFSHIEWSMLGYHIILETPIEEKNYIWVSKQELQDTYAIPTAFSIYLKD